MNDAASDISYTISTHEIFVRIVYGSYVPDLSFIHTFIDQNTWSVLVVTRHIAGGVVDGLETLEPSIIEDSTNHGEPPLAIVLQPLL